MGGLRHHHRPGRDPGAGQRHRTRLQLRERHRPRRDPVHHGADQAVDQRHDHGGGQSVTFTGTYDADFERTPSLAEAAGTYTGAGPSAGTTLTLATNGNVTGNQGTCNFTGTAAPRSDASAFDVSITFGGGTCQLGTSTLTGIAFYDAGEKALLSFVLNSGRTRAAIFTGTKP